MRFDATDHKEFFDDLNRDGFHIFSRTHARDKGFYPNVFPTDPEVDLSGIGIGDKVTVRAFFKKSKTAMSAIESGLLVLEVEYVDPEATHVFGNIVTELPPAFSLSKGTTIEVFAEEILSTSPR